MGGTVTTHRSNVPHLSDQLRTTAARLDELSGQLRQQPVLFGLHIQAVKSLRRCLGELSWGNWEGALVCCDQAQFLLKRMIDCPDRRPNGVNDSLARCQEIIARYKEAISELQSAANGAP